MIPIIYGSLDFQLGNPNRLKRFLGDKNTKIRLTMLCLSGFVLHSHWVPLTIMQQSMTTFSISFVFKGRESRSCYGINFLSQSAIDFKKSFFWAQKYNLKKRHQPKFSNMESHQPYLSFICSVPFWTNKGILHFYQADFRLCPNASV